LHLLFLIEELFDGFAILSYFALGYFFPLLEKLNVILLGFCFNHPIVLIHFSHKFDMSLVHSLHIIFYLLNMLFCEFNRNQSPVIVLSWRIVIQITLLEVRVVLGFIMEVFEWRVLILLLAVFILLMLWLGFRFLRLLLISSIISKVESLNEVLRINVFMVYIIIITWWWIWLLNSSLRLLPSPRR
jgi:hypothetical protein